MRFSVCCALALAAALAAGCADPLEPATPRTGEGVFYLHGYLDTAADTQRIRLERVQPLPGPAAPPEAAATLIELDSGRRFPMTFAPEPLADGGAGYAALAAVRVAPGGAYAVEVQAAEGAAARAATTAPPPAALTAALLPGDGYLLEAAWSPALRPPDRAVLWYVVGARPGAPAQRVVLEAPPGALGAGRWTVLVALRADLMRVRAGAGIPAADTAAVFYGMGMEAAWLSDEWRLPPDASNVAGGYGFFGSVTRLRAPIALPPATLAGLGFADRQGAGGNFPAP